MATRKPAAAPAPISAAAPAAVPARRLPPAAAKAAPRPVAAVKASPRPVAGAKAVPATVAAAFAADKPRKIDKPKKAPKVRPVLVRDSFTLPEADFGLIGTLKARALAGQRETKKSELLRAGLQALAAMDSATLLAALNALEPIKTGRPKKG